LAKLVVNCLVFGLGYDHDILLRRHFLKQRQGQFVD